MSIVAELWRYVRARQKYWLIPILVIILGFGALVILSEGSAVAPFIYTLF